MMQEIAKVSLDNEMDLILAHRRSMKLGELAGLSMPAQTSFATAVSEVARNAIDNGKHAVLVLSVDADQRTKYIVAALRNSQQQQNKEPEGLAYAKRLVNKFNVFNKDEETIVELFFQVSHSFRFDIAKLDEWRSFFRNEPPVSPYEEIKRKNEQLQELSEKIEKSEAQYKTLTNALPLIIFSLDLAGNLVYSNEWLVKYTGVPVEELNKERWQQVIHPDDYSSFSLILNNNDIKGSATIKTQARIRQNGSNEYLWHQLSLTPFKSDSGETSYWIGYMADIHAQKVFEETLKDNIELKRSQQELKNNQKMLETYIQELNRSNTELQQFAFVASHDLQEPVRKVLFYSDYLISQYHDTLDKKGADYLASMQAAAQRMRNLIQDLLVFSQINRKELNFRRVDLNKIAQDAVQDLEIAIEEKQAQITFGKLPEIQCDERMIRQLFENLLSNSLKYSRPDVPPVIEVGCHQHDGAYEISFTDNGIGFDEKYLPQMFALFQRLHTKTLYDGTGLGLAICKKVIEMHQGTINARSKEGAGATFVISLPVNQQAV